MLEVTSIRKGFVGGGYDGGRSLPKKMALEAGIPGASRIPDSAQLFSASPPRSGMRSGPDRIADLEALPGLTDQWPNGYFRNGTTMHVSHVYLDLELWYGEFSFDDRSGRRSGRGSTCPVGIERYRRARARRRASKASSTRSKASGSRPFGRPCSRRRGSPRRRSTTTATATRGAQPSSSEPASTRSTTRSPGPRPRSRSKWSPKPSAGLHFIPLLADGRHLPPRPPRDGHPRYAGGRRIPREARHKPTRQFNAVMKTTHRQNFLVPPRRHRSFRSPSCSRFLRQGRDYASAARGRPLLDEDEDLRDLLAPAPLLDREAAAQAEVDQHDVLLAALQHLRREESGLEPGGLRPGVADDEARLVAAQEVRLAEAQALFLEDNGT